MPNNLFDRLISAINTPDIEKVRKALNELGEKINTTSITSKERENANSTLKGAVNLAISKYCHAEPSQEGAATEILKEFFQNSTLENRPLLIVDKDDMFEVARKALERGDSELIKFICQHTGFNPSYAKENRSSPIRYTAVELKESCPKEGEAPSKRHTELHNCLLSLIERDDGYRRDTGEKPSIPREAPPRCCNNVAAGPSK